MNPSIEVAPYRYMPDVFRAVALQADERVPDPKSLVDADYHPEITPDETRRLIEQSPDVVAAWLQHVNNPDYTVNFPGRVALNGMAPEEALSNHITARWTDLSYYQRETRGSRLATRFPHFRAGVGSRFGEGYGWDTLLGFQGLLAEAKTSIDREWFIRRAVWTVENIAGTYGIVDEKEYNPNGLTDYLDTREQLPITSRMVTGLAEHFRQHPEELEQHFKGVTIMPTGEEAYIHVIEQFLPQLVKEHEYWMRPPRAVRMPGGLVVNIPSDSAHGPRDEMFAADMHEYELAKKASDVDESDFFRNKRIATARGRDFTGQVCRDPHRPETVFASEIAPIEFQTELLHLERAIYEQYARTGRSVKAAEYKTYIERRRASIQSFWDPTDGCFYDKNVRTGELIRYPNITTVYAVTAGAADTKQQEAVADFVQDRLFMAGGFVTSLCHTGQQWDFPNIFPIDQEEARMMFHRVGREGIAREADRRWLSHELGIFLEHGVVAEKHNSVSEVPTIGDGGEYRPQPDLLWTLGLARIVLNRMGIRATHRVRPPEHEQLVAAQRSRL